jgi:hypothetical protein
VPKATHRERSTVDHVVAVSCLLRVFFEPSIYLFEQIYRATLSFCILHVLLTSCCRTLLLLSHVWEKKKRVNWIGSAKKKQLATSRSSEYFYYIITYAESILLYSSLSNRLLNLSVIKSHTLRLASHFRRESLWIFFTYFIVMVRSGWN